jgi:hypothetical protein
LWKRPYVHSTADKYAAAHANDGANQRSDRRASAYGGADARADGDTDPFGA